MATLRAALKAKLEADATLMAILTGGVWAPGTINRTDTPTAYDSAGRLKPCAALAISTDAPEMASVRDIAVGRQYFFVWFYDEPASGYANIDAAIKQARATLHEATVTADEVSVYEITHADSIADTYDDTLRANARYSRYYAVYRRK